MSKESQYRNRIERIIKIQNAKDLKDLKEIHDLKEETAKSRKNQKDITKKELDKKTDKKTDKKNIMPSIDGVRKSIDSFQKKSNNKELEDEER